jgi:kynurenine 3-monooxygenase
MVPFYGQGMNAGLEDVRVLFSILDKYKFPSQSKDVETIAYESLGEVAHERAQGLAEYSEIRTADAHAINDLALQNYIEMRSSVTSPMYKLRKWLEEMLSVYVPSLGWQTKYSRVSFGNERYSEVIRKSERQGKLLVMGLVGVLASPVVVGGLVAWHRWRKSGTRAWLNGFK